MNLNKILLLLCISGFLLSSSSVFSQSPKNNLIELMREYVGMVEYDGETFFIDQTSSNSATEILFRSLEASANPSALIFDLSQIDIPSISIKSSLKSGSGIFEHFEIRFEGEGAIYEPNALRDSKQNNNISLCLAGKELFTPTTYEREIVGNIASLLKKAAADAKSIDKPVAERNYRIKTDDDLVRALLTAKNVRFEAKQKSGGYLTIQGGIKEFFGLVNAVCLEIATEVGERDIDPELSVDLVYILVRNHLGKRETVAEIPGNFPNTSTNKNCCRDCLAFPDRETFPSGAYEVFIYIGSQQARKLGNFMFAVR